MLLMFTITTFSQVNVAISGMAYISGTQITNCGNIDFGTNPTVRLQFGINLTKLSSQVVGTSDLYVYSIGSSGNRIERKHEIVQTVSFDTSYSSSADITMDQSDFSTSGGTLFAIFKSSGGVEYQTNCSYTITKSLLPTFTLSTTSLGLACGDTSAKTFSITQSNIPSGATVTYNWNYIGWSLVSSTATSRTLQPISGTSLPSNISVNPSINGVAYSALFCSVSRSSFSSSATITGTTSICSGTSTYPITGVIAGQTVTWSLSNPSIATLSSQTNAQTNVTFNGNGAQTLTATIGNTCGQTVTKSFVINTGTSTFTSTATIAGTSTICSSSSSYTISGILAGQTVSWSSSNSAIATVSNPTSNSITVNSVATGSVNLKATILNSCGQSAIVTYPIQIYVIPSMPIPSGYFGVDWVTDCYQDGPVAIIYYPNIPFGGVITISPTLLAHPLTSQTKNITVKYTNPCTGAYTTKVIVYNYQAPNCSGAKMSNNNTIYTVYPNPSKDIVNIELRDQNNQPTKGATITGELFDMTGQSISKVQILNNKAPFSVRGLKKGIYVLKVFINDQVETHQIAVE